GPDRRSIGHVASTIFCGAIGLVATAAIYLALAPSRDLGEWDPGGTDIVTVPRPNVAQLMQGPVAIVAVAAFVIACVRWIPTWLVLLPLGFMVMVQGLFMGIFHGVPTDGERWLFPLNTGVVNGEWKGCGPESFECTLAVSGFDTTTPWWHLGYLSALVVWFTTISVLRHRRDRRAWVAFAAASVLLAACATVQFTVADQFVVPS
ncbi:MAG TPA: hypothetical protein VMM60_11630, partial [Ilumatobacter sp.]|nr:hypothetical protein [Ilumatobacter sp.]